MNNTLNKYLSDKSDDSDNVQKKVQNLEEELVSVPFVQEVQQKLQVVETKLEETESFCYQVQ
jgi:cell fate (sporulation/competence/biofilm development) regulator YmcA (YheA/YmcA/DUF963 family)